MFYFVIVLNEYKERIAGQILSYRCPSRTLVIPCENENEVNMTIQYFTELYGKVEYRIVRPDDENTVAEAEFELKCELVGW